MRQARFTTAIRGFDKTDVTTFLQEAAEGFDHALRENERLRMEIVRLEASLQQFRELEGSLRTTLMTAQKVADDMRENAQQEAARIIREAEGRAELTLQRTQAKTEDIEREIDGLAGQAPRGGDQPRGTIARAAQYAGFHPRAGPPRARRSRRATSPEDRPRRGDENQPRFRIYEIYELTDLDCSIPFVNS